MKIAVLGGTGHIGIGLSLRLAIAGYDVIVGSRKVEKAQQKAEEYIACLEGRDAKGKSRERAMKKLQSLQTFQFLQYLSNTHTRRLKVLRTVSLER